MTDREEFEKVFKDKLLMDRHSYGTYWSDRTEDTWIGWKSAKESCRAEIERKDEVLEWWLEHAYEILPKEPDKRKGIPYKEEYQKGVNMTVVALSGEEG